MTWGQGFFRLWLVLSAIWIGLFIYFSKPVTYSWLWHAPKYEIEFKSGHKITLDGSMLHKDLVAALASELKLEASRPGQAINATAQDDILTVINSRYSTAGEQAEQIWLATFIPPLVLLVLGLAIAWILRGFRGAQA